ncbi:hypothetical protein I6I86_11180 (plasmid) [Moraxella osloensis]|nr:hypothetical protein [Moraxella osloensis]MBL7668499.1 hypothetical protein [Moraxella osloensis]
MRGRTHRRTNPIIGVIKLNPRESRADQDKTKELSPDTKLTIIIDTARLNETELAEYCRSKGSTLNKSPNENTDPHRLSTSEQQTSLNRNSNKPTKNKSTTQTRNQTQRQSACGGSAILILRKKLDTLWGDETNDSLSERQQLITLIDQATDKGARLHIACSEVNISKRTYRRWKVTNNTGDKRPIAVRAAPSNKLSDIERQAILNPAMNPALPVYAQPNRSHPT